MLGRLGSLQMELTKQLGLLLSEAKAPTVLTEPFLHKRHKDLAILIEFLLSVGGKTA